MHAGYRRVANAVNLDVGEVLLYSGRLADSAEEASWNSGEVCAFISMRLILASNLVALSLLKVRRLREQSFTRPFPTPGQVDGTRFSRGRDLPDTTTVQCWN